MDRCYEVAEKSSYPSTLKECLQVVQSELMFLLLSRLTGLKFHEDAEDTSSDEDDEDETKQIHGGKHHSRVIPCQINQFSGTFLMEDL